MKALMDSADPMMDSADPMMDSADPSSLNDACIVLVLLVLQIKPWCAVRLPSPSSPALSRPWPVQRSDGAQSEYTP